MSLRVEPITFHPLYMERVWGGRELERLYGRSLPDPTSPYGESWELVDRPSEQSLVEDGPWAGLTLHQLWTQHQREIFGDGYASHPRFPVLIKVLDARDDLSVQVHPPAHLASALGGEPKTEMWYIADCDPGAQLFVGVKPGVTRQSFEQAVAAGSVADCVQVLTPKPGDSIFIPSGRLHAIGAGFLIHEIQQNSDTTYRVFDWNRLGLDGHPRKLHVSESLASIDFNDTHPQLDIPNGNTLAACEYFKTDRLVLAPGQFVINPDPQHFSLVAVIHGSIQSTGRHRFREGQWLLMPCGATPLVVNENSVVLQVTIPTRD